MTSCMLKQQVHGRAELCCLDRLQERHDKPKELEEACMFARTRSIASFLISSSPAMPAASSRRNCRRSCRREREDEGGSSYGAAGEE